MPMNDEAMLEKLRAAFDLEAEERLTAITGGLLELEKTSDPNRRDSIVEAVFREAHSLKGAARAVNLSDVEALCQTMEGVLGALKRGDIGVSGGLLDTLHDSVKLIEVVLSSDSAQDGVSTAQIEAMLERLQCLRDEQGPTEEKNPVPDEIATSGVPIEAKEAPAASPAGPVMGRALTSGTVRISTRKLDSLLLKAEEMVSLKLVTGQHLDDLRGAMRTYTSWKERRSQFDSSIRSLRKWVGEDGSAGERGPRSNVLNNLLDFLDWERETIDALGCEAEKATVEAADAQRALGTMVDDLLDGVKEAAMLPFSTLFGFLPKMVRDLAREQGKEVDLEMQGTEIEIDKRILEELKSPLLHLLRNCVDHGLERPDERVGHDKPPRGTIRLSVSQTEGDKVELLVSDDGRGIDAQRVRARAVERGLLLEKDAAELDERASLGLVFRSGVSTSPTVTNISGRGLGLAIVHEMIEQFGGIVTVESAPGAGTAFCLRLPVTLATFRGIVVCVAGDRFVLPSSQIDRVLRVERESLRTVEGKASISLDGLPIALVAIADVLELPGRGAAEDPTATFPAVVLGTGDRRIAFLVDEIRNEHEVLVKGLGKQLKRVRNIAGAAVLGSGKPVLILHAQDLLKSAAGASAAAQSAPVGPGEPPSRNKSILVVEDSVTSRMLLKNILEGAGYEVKTAVDGLEAYTHIKTEEYGLVVSDVEMPRMDGFELTAKIRGEERLSEIPVVLVTGLDSREHRERGIDVGADAYIVKSSFDQSDLLEAIRRLL